jgi:hypothetical protein
MRRRFIQQPDGTLREVSLDHVPDMPVDSGALWGDRHYDGVCTPDGVDISSRSKHREYMRTHGLTTSDDFTGEWGKARQQRDDFFTTGGDHKERRQQLERALHENLNRRK